MENYKELYVIDEPIHTPLGDARFLKVKEYPVLLRYMPYLSLQKFEIIDKIREQSKEASDYFTEKQFIEIIHELASVYELEEMFSELFILCFGKDVFKLIKTDEEFKNYKNLIKDMNCIVVEEKNPNPEIEYFNELKRLMNKQKSNNVTFEAIYTSVWLTTGQNPNNMSIYQMYALFDRISHFKNYDMTLLYSSVSDKVQVENWFKSSDREDKKELTSLEQLQQQGKSL